MRNSGVYDPPGMSRTLFLSSLVLLFALPAQARTRTVTKQFPSCIMIKGAAAVTLSRDGGKTFLPIAETIGGNAYTYGVTAVDTRGTMLAWRYDFLLISNNYGCTWRVFESIPGADFPPTLSSVHDGRAYAWSDNRQFLVRWDSRGATKLKQPVPFVGFGIDRNDSTHVRAGGDDGSVWESVDAGETWTHIGSVTADSSPVIFYRFVFDPANLDHIVAGMTTSGAAVSRDGGRTWTKATGFGSGAVNAFNFAISPADGNTVWAMAINLAESDANVPSHGRHIFLSRDGGATYQAVVDESPAVKLVNGPTMAAHPTDRNVLYFVFGTFFQFHGTDLFRYDAATGALDLTHLMYDDVNAITFSPLDPNLMYIGIEVERGIN